MLLLPRMLSGAEPRLRMLVASFWWAAICWGGTVGAATIACHDFMRSLIKTKIGVFVCMGGLTPQAPVWKNKDEEWKKTYSE